MSKITVHAALTGAPTGFNVTANGLEASQLVDIEKAMVAGLQALIAEGEASAAGNPSVQAGEGERVTVALSLKATQDGKPFAEGGFKWHNMPPAYAAFVGRAFAGLDNAVAAEKAA